MNVSENECRIVVLISGNGSNLQALIDQCHQRPDDSKVPGQTGSKIVAVISNVASAFGLQRAEKADIPNLVVDHKKFSGRTDFDSDLRSKIDQFKPDLLVLAGFMRILTAEFVAHYHGRMLNIHPSLLPDYQGLNTHQRVIQDGKSQHGATVHFVTEELDGGPPVLQAVVPVLPDDTAELLARRVQVQEHAIFPEAVRLFSNGRLAMEGSQAKLDGKVLPKTGIRLQNIADS